MYSVPGAPNKVNIARDGATLYFRPASQAGGVALEATAENKFKSGPVLVFEFDTDKGEMILTRGGQNRVQEAARVDTGESRGVCQYIKRARQKKSWVDCGSGNLPSE